MRGEDESNIRGGETDMDLYCPLGKNEWRYNNGYVCCGSIRIFRLDIDTNPSVDFTNKLMKWVIQRLNSAI